MRGGMIPSYAGGFMRRIDLVILHCSASDRAEDDSIEAVNRLHTSDITEPIKWGKYNTTGKGWSDCGYHYLITKDGLIQAGRQVERAGAHCKGFNSHSIGVCFSGDKEFTPAQFRAWRKLNASLIKKYGIDIDVKPHNHFSKYKTCPNFDMKRLEE